MKIDKENKIVYLPYTASDELVKQWQAKGYKVQLEIE
jgi:hypothetical protein